MKINRPPFILASGRYSYEINDNNLPAYFYNYYVSITNELGNIQESTISLVPSAIKDERILNVTCVGELQYITGRVQTWDIVFHVSDITIFQQFKLEYGLEGMLTLPSLSTTKWNASSFIDYYYDTQNLDIHFTIDLTSLKSDISSLEYIPFSFNLYIQDDLERSKYVRDAYKIFEFPFQYTGIGQRILVGSELLSGYSLEDIVVYLTVQGIVGGNGQLKTAEQLYTQISYVNVTTFTTVYFPNDGQYYPIPLCDGYYCRIPMAELYGSTELTMNLQYIFSVAPDANVIIAYHGCNCDPNSGNQTSEVQAEMEFITYINNNSSSFDIICDNYGHKLASAYNNEEADYFQATFDKLYNERIPVFEASGNSSGSLIDYWNVCKYVISLGGMEFVKVNDAYVESCYEQSSGGFYASRFPFPTYQIGAVEPQVPFNKNNISTNFIGVPTCSGIASNMAIIFNYNTLYGHGTSLTCPVMSGLCALINQATNTTWKYIDILYYEYAYLFNYIDKGGNNQYKASDFTEWNPIAGFGVVNGTYLLNLLNPARIYSGDHLCISSFVIQNKLSFMNFFPPTDFLNEEIRQPVFGPQSYWSYLRIYRLVDGTDLLDLLEGEITDGDRVVIFSALPELYWVMTWDLEGTVKLEKYNNTVTQNMQWIITMEHQNAFYENILFSPVSDPNLYLSSAFVLASSPSLIDIRNDSCHFFFRRHSWFLYQPTLYEILLNSNQSYYVNITNSKYFVSSGYSFDNYLLGRSMVYDTDVLVQFGDFSVYPEFMLVPLIPDEDGVLNITSLFAIFNTRIQAFVRNVNINNSTSSCIYFNVNSTSSGLRTYYYDECVFSFSKMKPDNSDFMFYPTFTKGPFIAQPPVSSCIRYDDYFTSVYMNNPTGYFHTPTFWFTNSNNRNQPLSTSIDIVQADALFIFSVSPGYMYSSQHKEMWLRQVYYKSFLNECVYGNPSGEYMLMTTYDNVAIANGDMSQKWILDSTYDTEPFVYNADYQQEWYYTSATSKFTMTSASKYMADVSNVTQWQPQVLSYNGIDTVGHWKLFPLVGPSTNYLYTCALYDLQNAKTNRYVSLNLGLKHTPAMFTNSSSSKPQQYICIYDTRNDFFEP